jgi:AraC-like DNA-binding protein
MSFPDHPASLIENPDSYRPANPLIELLRSIRLTGSLEVHVSNRAPWGVEQPSPDDTLLVYMIRYGSCLVLLQDQDEAIELSAGDVFLVLRPLRFAIADSRSTPLIPLERVIKDVVPLASFADEQLSIIFRMHFSHGGTGSETGLTCLRLYVDDRFPSALRRGLPAHAHLKGFCARHKTFVDGIVQLIAETGATGFIGQSIATRLGEALLTKFLTEILGQDAVDPGIHRALRDTFIASAISDMQRKPEEHWSIERLSRSAGLSRSAFLERFESVVGMTPSEFQARLRMTRAVELIENTSLPLAEIAAQIGYGSEAAFNRAFTRRMGATPGSFRKPRGSNGANPTQR